MSETLMVTFRYITAFTKNNVRYEGVIVSGVGEVNGTEPAILEPIEMYVVTITTGIVADSNGVTLHEFGPGSVIRVNPKYCEVV